MFSTIVADKEAEFERDMIQGMPNHRGESGPVVIQSDRLRMLLERLISFEKYILYQDYATQKEPEFTYNPGIVPILISAPHGAAHTRHGNYKGEDEYTASFAQVISESTGAHCIYSRRKSKTDPNVAKDAPYKEKVRQICTKNEIKFVIDLHGMRPIHEVGIELGTRNGKSCPDQKELILQSLGDSGFIADNDDKLLRTRIDAHFSGLGSHTREPMVKFVSERLQIPAVQIEINACNRIVERKNDAAEKDKSFRGNPALIEQTINAFICITNALHQSFQV